MSDMKTPLRSPLLKDNIDSPNPAGSPIPMPDLNEDGYFDSNNEPAVPFKKLALAVLPGLLVAGNILLAETFSIPSLQYLFVTVLFSFLINYYIVRRYQLYPYLKEDKYDRLLKVMCVLAFFSFLTSIQWGWNGSGGILVAIIWEVTRGHRMGSLAYGYIVIVIGSVLLEGNYSYTKLLEFIPGVLLGLINSALFTLGESSPYTIYHEFSLLCCIFLPVFFPIQSMIKPDIRQWGVMLAASLLVEFTFLLVIKMMQKERVSISMTCFCSIVLLLTTTYMTTLSILEGALVLVGLAFILYKEYFNQEEQQ